MTESTFVHGDYTHLAKHYGHRAGYSLTVLNALANYVGSAGERPLFADVGAGTGKLTENLLDVGLSGYAVEPNDSMRAEGMVYYNHPGRLTWMKGSAEATELPDGCVDWVLMGSSFHWVDSDLALPEFHRILKPGGFLTALWNPRALDMSELEQRVEDRIHQIVPELKRVSSGGSKYTQSIDDTLESTGQFDNVIFMEAPHRVIMSKTRYLGLWESVNDVRVQAGELRFQQIRRAIQDEIADVEQIVARYRTRAWTVRRIDG